MTRIFRDSELVAENMETRRSLYRWLAAIAAGVFLLVLWSSNISDSPIESDATHTLWMAINLERNGVMSLEELPPYKPTMYREPIPALVSAIALQVSDFVVGPTNPTQYFTGDRAKYLKYQNVAWLTLLTASAFWIVHALTASYYVALFGAVAANIKVFGIASGPGGLAIDSLYSDLPAAAVLIFASTLLAIAVRKNSSLFFAYAGFAFGLLALIKAAVLYIFVGVVAVTVVRASFLVYRKRNWRFGVQAVALTVAFAVVVVPWMYRNYVQLGSFAISDRGGGVLTIRTTLNEMTSDEIRGALYSWGPGRLQPLLGQLTGFSQADLEYGGRLQRLNRSESSSFANDDITAMNMGNPELVVSYYRRAGAEIVQLKLELEARGHPFPGQEARKIMQQRALSSIVDNPMRHLLMSGLFMWRGAPIAFPIILVALCFALKARHEMLGFFLLPAFGTAAFYALLSHFIPRYGVPIGPITIVSLVLIGYWMVRSLRHKPRKSSG